jgi:error-prone DNA polymerase
MGYYPPRVLIAEAKRAGVRILNIDIHRSFDYYNVEDGAIRISLKQLKGMSGEAVESILAGRGKGEFTSLRDFVLRTGVSQPVTENLIRAGAFDSLGVRGKLLLQLPGLMKLKQKAPKGTGPMINDAMSGYDSPGENPGVEKREIMLAERELLSMDLSAHPLDFFSLDDGLTRMKNLPSIAAGETVKIIGSVIRYQTPPTRNGNRVVYVIMEDGTGIADVTVFGDVQERCGQVLFRAGWLAVEGKIQKRGPKATSIIAENLSVIEPAKTMLQFPYDR